MNALTYQILFGQDEFEAAAREWNCNCGPSALAAALGWTLDEVREIVEQAGFGARGYTSPTMMRDCIDMAGRTFREITRRRRLPPSILPEPLPICGLVRVQWTGPWTAPGANPRWAYRHTHWIASFNLPEREGGCYVFDCNGGARTYRSWADEIVPILTSHTPRADGDWFATHLWEMCRG